MVLAAYKEIACFVISGRGCIFQRSQITKKRYVPKNLRLSPKYLNVTTEWHLFPAKIVSYMLSSSGGNECTAISIRLLNKIVQL